MKRTLNAFLWSLGIQYIVRSLCCVILQPSLSCSPFVTCSDTTVFSCIWAETYDLLLIISWHMNIAIPVVGHLKNVCTKYQYDKLIFSGGEEDFQSVFVAWGIMAPPLAPLYLNYHRDFDILGVLNTYIYAKSYNHKIAYYE